MRKSLVCTAALAALGLGAPASAQTPVSVGPLLGVNLADIAGDDFSDAFGSTSSRFGFAVGGFAEFGISDMLVFRPELVYSQKGAEIDDDIVDATVKLDYVQVPMLVKLLFGAPDADMRFSLILGPAFGFSTGCAFDVDEAVVVAAGPSLATAAARVEIDCDEVGAETKGVELAGMLGGGVDFGRFTVDLRMDRGFTGIFDVEDVDSKNQTFSIRAGYKFSLR